MFYPQAVKVWRRDHEVIDAATSSENCSIHSKLMSVVSPAWFIEREAVPKSPLLPLLKSNNCSTKNCRIKLIFKSAYCNKNKIPYFFQVLLRIKGRSYRFN